MLIEENIKNIRKEKGLNYREMARLTGVAISTLCNLELGRIKNPSIRLLTKICKGLDIGVKDLIKDTEFDC